MYVRVNGRSHGKPDASGWRAGDSSGSTVDHLHNFVDVRDNLVHVPMCSQKLLEGVTILVGVGS